MENKKPEKSSDDEAEYERLRKFVENWFNQPPKQDRVGQIFIQPAGKIINDNKKEGK